MIAVIKSLRVGVAQRRWMIATITSSYAAGIGSERLAQDLFLVRPRNVVGVEVDECPDLRVGRVSLARAAGPGACQTCRKRSVTLRFEVGHSHVHVQYLGRLGEVKQPRTRGWKNVPAVVSPGNQCRLALPVLLLPWLSHQLRDHSSYVFSRSTPGSLLEALKARRNGFVVARSLPFR